MDSNLKAVLQGYGFTIENTGGHCEAWVKHFDVKQNPRQEFFCDPYLMLTQGGDADIEEKDIETCGLNLSYYEYSVEEESHFFTDFELYTLDGLLALLDRIFSPDHPEFPDFDNWQGFALAAKELRKHGFSPDLDRNGVMPCISYQGANENNSFPQIKLWFNWYNSDLSEQSGKLYAVASYSPEGAKLQEHEFDNLDQALRVARTIQVLLSS